SGGARGSSCRHFIRRRLLRCPEGGKSLGKRPRRCNCLRRQGRALFEYRPVQRKAMESKLEQLKDALRKTEGVMVAFSAGVDSTFLLKVAHMVLGERAVALTGSSATAPPGELAAAREFAASLGIRHIVLDSHELANPSFTQNPANRCFFCKDELYKICR